MNNIPQTISQVLDVLSSKFGTTGQVLWQAVLKQQYIYGFFALFCSLISLIGICFMPLWSKKALKNDCDSIWWLPWGMVMAILILCFLAFGYDALTHLSNPVYSAISDILSSVSGKNN